MIPQMETLEDRALCSLGPVTPLHFAPGNLGTDGFNLIGISTPQQLAQMPAGDKAMVWLGMTNGADQSFQQAVAPYLGDPRVYGFYVADEPNSSVVPAANLKAESDWIHQHDPGAKTFFVMGAGPLYAPVYTPATTDMDFVGLDPYPARTWGFIPWCIPAACLSAEMIGWSQAQIIPVYQAFGGIGDFAVPDALEEEIGLALWSVLTPEPAFDYAFSWSDYSGSTAMQDVPDLQAVFADHNAHAVSLWALWAELAAL